MPRTLALVRHRHDQHRFGAARLADDQAPRVGVGVAEQERLAVLRDPAGQALADADPEQLGLGVGRAHEHALERDRLAPAGLVVDAVHADGVVGDQRARPRRRSPRRCRARPGCRTAAPTGPGSPGAARRGPPPRPSSRALPIAVAIVSPKLRASATSSAVQSYGCCGRGRAARAGRRGRRGHEAQRGDAAPRYSSRMSAVMPGSMSR